MAQLRPLDCGTGATRWCIFFLRLFWKFSLKAFSDGNVALDSQAAPLSSTKWFWRQHGCWGGLFRPRWGSVSFAYQWEVCGTDCSSSSPKHCAAGGLLSTFSPRRNLRGWDFGICNKQYFREHALKHLTTVEQETTHCIHKANQIIKFLHIFLLSERENRLSTWIIC